MRNQKNWYC